MPVTTKHSEYTENAPEWEQNRTCVKGSKAVKKAKTKYLPQPMADDTSNENQARYDAYLERANYVNFTGSTKDGMTGMVFRNEMGVEFQENIAYLEKNANGFGLTLDQLARAIVGDVIDTGREGLLVDYPVVNNAPSAADSGKTQAMIIKYKAESVINWETTVIDGVKVLSMVVLREPTKVSSDDKFSVNEEMYHRVLLLENGVYFQNIYDEKDNLITSNGDNGNIIPTKEDGTTWDRIPFVFIGAINNDESVDKSPLTDLSDVNIAHYRNSADYEESSFMVGQPTPYAAGLTQNWVNENMEGEVRIGSRAFLLLPEGGSAGMLQSQPNIMPREGMQDKELQMVKIGARIITDNTGNETAEAAKIRFAGQNSKLGIIVGNTEAGLVQAIEYVIMFMGGSEEFTIELNKEFYDKSIDPQFIMANIQLMDRGAIAMKDLRTQLRGSGVIENGRTDEDIDNEATDEVMGADLV